jgi:flagellar protein FlaJ
VAEVKSNTNTALTPLQRRAYHMFGERAKKAKNLDKLAEALRKSHIPVRAEAYIAYAMLMAIIVGVATLVLAGLVVFAGVYALDWTWLAFGLVPLAGVLGAALGFAAIQSTPASKAKSRGKKIDRKAPYIANYMAAMAGAGVIPLEIFKSLARQEIYGEAAKEAAWIFKDMEVHGMDIITALQRAGERTPSRKFQELLQGAITTITSGGDLTSYLRARADRFQFENRVEQKTFIETMGIMAETYVTAAVAGPLFLIVMVAIIVLIGSGEMSQLQLIVYLLLPIINFGFVFGVKAMIPET